MSGKMNVMLQSHAVDIECASLGSRLKSARIAKNITQEHLSKLVGVSRGKIVAAEKGHTTTATLVAIMIVLGREDELHLILENDPGFNYSERKPRMKKKRQRASRKKSDL
jgi:transcriptional regulator with XRE-family HTH domain